MRTTRVFLYLVTVVLLIVWAVNIGCNGKKESVIGDGMVVTEKRGTVEYFDLMVYDSIGKIVAIDTSCNLIVYDSLRAIKELLYIIQKDSKYSKCKNLK